jgi:hypothetical protein
MSMKNKTLNIQNTHRLFQCARCFTQVNICTYCDRGNIYCKGSCSFLARKTAQLAASTRYQDTFKGKRQHAICQQRYRARLRAKLAACDNKVIDQGSQFNPSELPSPPVTQTAFSLQEIVRICDFCGRKVLGFSRRSFLNAYRHLTQVSSRLRMALGP